MEGEGERRAFASTWVEAVCVVAALILLVVSLMALSQLGGSDPLSRSLSSTVAAIALFLLWMPIFAFVALRCRGAKLGGLLAVGMVVCGVGLIFSLMAIAVMETPNWVRITPVALSLLALLYGFWAPFAAPWPVPWRRVATLGFLALAAVATVPVFVEEQRLAALAPARAAAAEKAEAQAQAEYRRSEAEFAAQREAQYRSLGPDSRLEQFFTFLLSDRAAETIAKIRTVRSRQADAVHLLDGDAELYHFQRMPEFGLEATPELCRAYRARIARKLTQPDPNNPNPNDVAVELSGYIDDFRWLDANGCDMADLAAQVRDRLRRHPNEYARSQAAPFEEIR